MKIKLLLKSSQNLQNIHSNKHNLSETPLACEPSYFIHTWTKCWVQNSLLYIDGKCHLNRRNWVKTRRLFPSKIFEKIRKNPCLEPIIRRFNIPIILVKTWQFAHGNIESRKMLNWNIIFHIGLSIPTEL